MCQQHPSTGSFDYSCGSAQGNYRITVRHAVYGSSNVTELPKPLCPRRKKRAEAMKKWPARGGS